MAVYYLDTSALVKLYVQELGTEVVLSLTSDLENDRLAILDLARVELRSAVRRRERASDIDSAQAFQMLGQFDEHLSELYLTQPCNSSVVEEAVRLLDHQSLCAYDALQLAGAIVLQSGGLSEMTFVCADKDLVQAARAEGLTVIDPEAREAEFEAEG
ncbi:MAG: type II toxin-antitoxin system VapC family toxin [Acidobacteria bacterium]|nr:type II toxin-antitoxin system VapC family toxin [Acidobacteriota bacterium]MDA1235770.1 type II toxin-antitoxin system VapC family toxin [Acidobacteriota bacterium]